MASFKRLLSQERTLDGRIADLMDESQREADRFDKWDRMANKLECRNNADGYGFTRPEVLQEVACYRDVANEAYAKAQFALKLARMDSAALEKIRTEIARQRRHRRIANAFLAGLVVGTGIFLFNLISL